MDLAEKFKTYKWLPEGKAIDTTDLAAKLQADLQDAEKAAAAVGSAAVGISANEAADKTSNRIREAVRAAKTDFLSGDTYRAATMSIRADYAKGEDRTVKAIDRVKSINEKIRSACEGTEAALANLGVG